MELDAYLPLIFQKKSESEYKKNWFKSAYIRIKKNHQFLSKYKKNLWKKKSSGMRLYSIKYGNNYFYFIDDLLPGNYEKSKKRKKVSSALFIWFKYKT